MSKILDPTGLPVHKEGTIGLDDLHVSTDFSMETGRGTVRIKIPGTDKAYQMLPAEARILGMQLITQATEAVDNAIFLRVMLEVIRMPPAEAVALLRQVGGGTRADHAAVYEAMHMAAQRQRAMEEDMTNGASKPN